MKLLVLFSILVCSSAECWGEPLYEGRPLSAWQSQAKEKDANRRAAAASALGQMGREAADALAELARDKEPNVRRAAVDALRHVGRNDQTVIPILP